ncbi:MAG TPA: sigma-70 family RNA polymerase sigma factor, partial [Bacteroidota bacterium]|nr:sigma-70 family RNA polymerase sigma factor [Bacteroidota bacterium]
MDAQAETLTRSYEIGQRAGEVREKLLGFIRRRVRTDSQAEDILQDVFAQLLTSYDLAAPLEQMTGWLYTVARNRIIDWYRKRRPADRALEEVIDDGSLTLGDMVPSDAGGPDEGYDRDVIAEELTEALEELPAKQREVFVMHEIEGRSFNEIREITG